METRPIATISFKEMRGGSYFILARELSNPNGITGYYRKKDERFAKEGNATRHSPFFTPALGQVTIDPNEKIIVFRDR